MDTDVKGNHHNAKTMHTNAYQCVHTRDRSKWIIENYLDPNNCQQTGDHALGNYLQASRAENNTTTTATHKHGFHALAHQIQEIWFVSCASFPHAALISHSE